MRLLRLTVNHLNGMELDYTETRLFNVAHIVWICATERQGAVISLTTGETFLVSESLDQIARGGL